MTENAIELFYDFVSARSFLAFREALQKRAKGQEIRLRPVHLVRLGELVGVRKAPFVRPTPEAKARYLELDVARDGRLAGVVLTPPPGHPQDTSLALRAAIGSNDIWAATQALFEAYWSGCSIDGVEHIRRILDKAGLDGSAATERAAAPAASDDLAQRTRSAVSAGVFDVPCFAWQVAGELELSIGQPCDPGQTQANAPGRSAASTSECAAFEFFFDYASPFAYLAATQVERIASRAGARVELRPILLGGLFKALGTANVPLFEMCEAERQYQLRILTRRAAQLGVPFRFTSHFPMNTVKALRLTLAAPRAQQHALMLAIFTALWANDQDVSNDDVLRSIASEVGIDVAALDAQLESSSLKLALRQATDAACARGIFGVPTMCVGSEVFWGQDRIERVEQLLAAQTTS